MWRILLFAAFLTAVAFCEEEVTDCGENREFDRETEECICKQGFHMPEGRFFSEECQEDKCKYITCAENQYCKLSNCKCKMGFKDVGHGTLKCVNANIVEAIDIPPKISENTASTATSTKIPITIPSTTSTSTSTSTTTSSPASIPTTNSTSTTTTTTTVVPILSTYPLVSTLNIKLEPTYQSAKIVNFWEIAGILIIIACISGYVGYIYNRHRYGSYIMPEPGEELNDFALSNEKFI